MTRSVAAWTSLLLMFSVIAMGVAVAQVSGSNFEIQDGNLIVDGEDPAIDWAGAGVDYEFKEDQPTGSGDDSFGQGTKEDTEVPTVVDGSIPPNKSDLKSFGIYEEENDDGKFLHLFWTRVQDPRGTTNMDFEFNQSEVLSANGVTPERTPGDVLIVYELSKGGSVPLLFSFTWLDGTEDPQIECEASNSYPCWGDRTDLLAAGGAEGSINEVFIPAAESDGLGDLDPRTFGEASIDLSLILDPTKCSSFGSAYLKSRSSDSFTSALKDFIAPLGVTITNCGSVTIRKVTVPSPDSFDTGFGFTSNVATDPPGDFPSSFSLKDGGIQSSDLVLSGTGYTVTEADPGPAYALTDVDCSASDADLVTDITGGEVTFNMVVGGTVDCTYTNTLQTGSITVVKQTIGGVGAFSFTSNTLTPASFDLTTTAQGPPGVSTLFDDLNPGTYDVSETVPTGWDLTSATCSDGSAVDNIVVSPNEDVTCTFVNTKRGKILVDKVTDPTGSTQSFGFALTGGPDTLNRSFSLTDQETPYDSDFIKPGTYAVSETVATGWTLDTVTCSDGSEPGLLGLAAGETVTCTFENSIGAIEISKTAKNATAQDDVPLAEVDFEIKDGDGTVVATATTDSTGTACVDGLIVGANYTVTETAAPTGYDPTAVDPQDVVATAAECGGAGTPAAVSFSNDPLSKITIGFESLAGDGVTLATSVVCTGPGGFDSGELGTLGDDSNPESASITDLVEGTYVCTILVDP